MHTSRSVHIDTLFEVSSNYDVLLYNVFATDGVTLVNVTSIRVEVTNVTHTVEPVPL